MLMTGNFERLCLYFFGKVAPSVVPRLVAKSAVAAATQVTMVTSGSEFVCEADVIAQVITYTISIYIIIYQNSE